MMRSPYGIIIAGCLLVAVCLGCSGAKDSLKEVSPSLISVSPEKQYTRKIAVMLAYAPPTAIGRQMGERYVDKLVEALIDESDRIELVTYKDSGFPYFFMSLARQDPTTDDIATVAAAARRSGYNSWALARIDGMRPEAKRTGVLWFAKLRHFVYFNLTLTLYDTITGAKIIDEVIETSTKIDENQYQAIKSGQAGDLPDLADKIDDIAEDLAEKVVDALKDQPWRTSVLKVENNRIFLPAGSGSGLRAGDRLSVFEGRRTFEGQNNAQFLLPGFQIAQIEIVTVTAQSSEAKVLDASAGNPVQAGDFAAAVK